MNKHYYVCISILFNLHHQITEWRVQSFGFAHLVSVRLTACVIFTTILLSHL